MTDERAPLSHEYARALFVEMGLVGYRVGEILRALGDTVIVHEVDYFRGEDDQETEQKYPLEIFPDDIDMLPGVRYSIVTHLHKSANFRVTDTQVTVYGDLFREEDATHMLLLPETEDEPDFGFDY